MAWACGVYYCNVASFILLLTSVFVRNRCHRHSPTVRFENGTLFTHAVILEPWLHVGGLSLGSSHTYAEGWGAFTHPVIPLPQEATVEVRNDPPHSR